LPVGSFEEGGLTFEQRKRLAIAVELAASPSVIFLDEPTSGLDSRGALVVMRAMDKIALTGRTICATIHQPSLAVFEVFDDSLLLKRGGEVVFFGELGPESNYLVDYFEERGATPINHGENPAAWMLRQYIGSDSVDWKELFEQSEQFRAAKEQIAQLQEDPDETKKISYDSEFAVGLLRQTELMNRRVLTTTIVFPLCHAAGNTLDYCPKKIRY
jgi:ABC-type multidrug transport system ATPase subunit